MSYTAKKNTNGGKMYNHREPKESVKDVLELPFADLSSRGIRKEICEKFGVRMAVSTEDGVTPEAIYFPYYDQQNKLSGFKKRDLTVDKNDDFHFTAVGKVSVGCKMFGQTVTEGVQRKKQNIIICEGEYDLLTIYQAGIDSVAGTQYAGLEPFVVSISLGTANAVDSVLSNGSFVKEFEKVIIAFDADSASPCEKKRKIKRGAEATVDVAIALMADNIYVASMVDGYKDPNECLMAGKGKEMIKNITFNARKFIGEKIVTASDISLDFLIEERQVGVMVPAFPELMNKIRGFRLNELTILTSPSNSGKSTVCAEFAYSFLDQGYRVGFMMLEEQSKETMQRMIARRLGVNFNTFKDKPLSVATKEQIEEAYAWLTENNKMFILDHFGSMSTDDLMNKIKSFVLIQKCDYIILDHLSMVISGSKVTDERKEMDLIMTELAAFCASNSVGVIAVSHINRSNAAEFKPQKGKEDEPFWVNVTKESMRSSSALEQLSWIVLGLEPQIMPDKSRGNVRLTVLKNRPWGYLGVADEFSMNDKTGLLECIGGRF